MRDLWQQGQAPKHVVAIIGGAVSGSEAARTLADQGIACVVIEQNARPYGKIEDGLPRWHVKLRDAEYAKINENLARPNVWFVPKTKLGHSLSLDELLHGWGVDAVILASGAWRDRPLGIAGIDQYINRGLVYQNPFVYWFNHYNDPDYAGPRYEVSDDAIVIGGGLASIDVVKIINFELFGQALRQRGIDVDAETMEHQGIPSLLQRHGLSQDALGIKGCTLYYRRRKSDMPLAAAPENATEEQLKKTGIARERIMNKVMEKYLVRFEECQTPIEAIVESDRLVGLRFARTEIIQGKVVIVPGSEHDVRANLVVSSVGSIPEPLEGIPTQGELFQWRDGETGELEGIENVFGLGNVLTGKGNIKASRQNAKQISQGVMARFLGATEDESIQEAVDLGHAQVRQQVEDLADKVQCKRARTAEELKRIAEGVKARWDAVGYDGHYDKWMIK